MAKYAKLPDEPSSKKNEDADEVVREVSKGLRVAKAAMTESAATSIEGLISQTNLPALDGDDPLHDLATRLDREADLWRNLAFREMARMAWSARFITGVAVLVVLSDLALAAVAGLGALFGAEQAAGRSMLVGVAAVVVTLALAVVPAIALASKRSQRELVQSALSRADVAELRLHRVGIALAYKRTDETRYMEALTRLERDAS